MIGAAAPEGHAGDPAPEDYEAYCVDGGYADACNLAQPFPSQMMAVAHAFAIMGSVVPERPSGADGR